MKNFNYINRDYVNPIDLNVLGRTYDTLEQGHQEAVKAASDLEVTMASLDLNEAESEWRQGKLAEIRQTVADNTNHGNAYGALDDIIAKAGNIASDQGMIGRLQAQKDFKTYRDQLDKRGDIPEAYKEMFREQNTYNYQDRVDEKTGAIIGGTKWEPTTRPVATIDHFGVMSKALQIAAKESGGGESITFLDVNGVPTRDASKSATGEMYMKSGSSYQRLTADKIRLAITSAMNSTPGAKESLEQDYKFSTWKYDKDVKANDGKPIVQEGVTDKFGNILKFEDYVDRKVTPFVNAAKYNNFSSNIQVGTALQTRRAQQAALASANATTNAAKNIIPANTVGKVEVDVDNYATSVMNKNAANSSALNILKKYSPDVAGKFSNVTEFINDLKGNDKVFGPGLAVNKYIKSLESKGVSLNPTDKNALINSVKGYVSYNTEQKKIENSVPAQDRQSLRFGESISTGEYKAGNSKWDDEIISNNNKIWKDNDKVEVHISPKLLKNLNAKFGVNRLDEAGINTTINEDGETIAIFSPNDRNMLPMFMSNLKKADDETGASWTALGNAIKGNRYRDYTIKTQPKPNAYGAMDRPDVIVDTYVDKIANSYNSGIEKAAIVQKKAGVQKGILSIEGTAKDNFKQIELDDIYHKGGMKLADYNAETKIATETVNNMFASGDFNSGQLYEADANNQFTKSSKANEMGALVSYMYQKHPNNITRNAIIPSGITDTRKGNNVPLKGYVLNFTVPKNSEDDVLKEYAGKSIKLMYGGGLKEAVSTDPALATSNVVTNIYNTSKATNTSGVVLPYHDALGSTDVVFDKGKPVINFLGSSIPAVEKQAIEYMKNIYSLDNIKSVVKAGMVQDPNQLNNGLNTIINNISTYTGKDPAIVRTAVYNYVNQ